MVALLLAVVCQGFLNTQSTFYSVLPNTVIENTVGAVDYELDLAQSVWTSSQCQSCHNASNYFDEITCNFCVKTQGISRDALPLQALHRARSIPQRLKQDHAKRKLLDAPLVPGVISVHPSSLVFVSRKVGNVWYSNPASQLLEMWVENCSLSGASEVRVLKNVTWLTLLDINGTSGNSFDDRLHVQILAECVSSALQTWSQVGLLTVEAAGSCGVSSNVSVHLECSYEDRMPSDTVRMFDRHDNLQRVVEPNGQITNFYVDPASGRLLEQASVRQSSKRSDSSLDTTSSVRLDYDAVGNLIGIQDWLGLTSFQRSPLGIVVQATELVPTPSQTLSSQVDYEYDSDARLSRMIYPAISADRFWVKYNYDANSRLSSVQPSKYCPSVSYKYSQTGELIELMYSNGLQSIFTPHPSIPDCYSAMEHLDSNTGLRFIHATYLCDSLGRVLEEQATICTEVAECRQSAKSYSFDDLDRIVGESYTDFSSRRTTSYSYTYDAANNRASKTVAVFDVDTGARLLFDESAYSNIGDRLVQANETKIFYDENGFVVLQQSPSEVVEYVWSMTNLLRKVVIQSLDPTTGFIIDTDIIEYIRNGQGHLVARVVNGVMESYMSNNIIMKPVPLVTLDASGAAKTLYVYGHDRLFEVDLYTSVCTIPLNDQIAYGNTRGLVSTTAAGSLKLDASIDVLDSFGDFQYFSAIEVSKSMRYAGEVIDMANIVVMYARVYNPSWGRFLSPDVYPNDVAGAQPANRYVYASHDPAHRRDPLGLTDGPVTYMVRLAVATAGLAINMMSVYQGVGWVLFGAALVVTGDIPIGAAVIAAGGIKAVTSAIAVVDNVNTLAKLAGYAGFYQSNSLLGEALSYHCNDASCSNRWNTVADGINLFNGLTTAGTLGVGAKLESMGVPSAMPLVRGLVHDIETTSVSRVFLTPRAARLYEITDQGLQVDEISHQDFGLPSITDAPSLLYRTLSGTFQDITSSFHSTHSVDYSGLGGVDLSTTAVLLGQLSRITGAAFDASSGQLLFFGNKTKELNWPSVSYELFAIAAIAVFSGTDPGVSIEPSGNPTFQSVRYTGAGVGNTRFGDVLFQADRVLKMLMQGQDNVAKTPVSVPIAGYKSLVQMVASDPTGFGCGGASMSYRMWWTPQEVSMAQSPDKTGIMITSVKMKLHYETKKDGVVVADPISAAFTAHIENNYDAYCRVFPIWRNMTVLAEVVGVLRWLKNNSIPLDLSFLTKMNASTLFLQNPDTTPTVITTATGKCTVSMTGGVLYSVQNTVTHDVSSAMSSFAQELRDSRPNETQFVWKYGNSTAVAQSFARKRKQGNVQFFMRDLESPMNGGLKLGFTRYYNSFDDTDVAGLGRGWSIAPYQVRFPSGRQVFYLGPQKMSYNLYPELFLNDLENRREVEFLLLGIDANSQPVYRPENSTDAITVDPLSGHLLFRRGVTRAFIEFFSDGRLYSVMDMSQNRICFCYTMNSHQISEIVDATLLPGKNCSRAPFPGARTISLIRDSGGRLTRVVGAEGNSIDFAFGTSSLLRGSHIGLPNAVSYNYDTSSRLTEISMNNRIVVGYEYDVYHRVKRVYQQAPDGVGTVDLTTGSYDLSKATNEVNLNGLQRSSKLDSEGRPVAFLDGSGHATTHEYSDDGYLLSIHNKYGRVVSSYTYDSKNLRADSVTRASTGETKYYYDSLAQTVATKTATGYATAYRYDELRRKVAMCPGATVISTSPAVSWTSINYDSSTCTTFAYDNKGNLATVTLPSGVTKSYQYDDSGNVVAILTSDQVERQYEYDAGGRVVGAHTADPRQSATVNYDIFGRRESITCAKGTYFLKKNQTATGNLNLTASVATFRQLVNSSNSTMLSEVVFDANGRVIAANGLDHRTNYTYDGLSTRLVSTITSSGEKRFSYDSEYRTVVSSLKLEPTPPIPVILLGPLMKITSPSLASDGVSLALGQTWLPGSITSPFFINNVGGSSLDITELSTLAPFSLSLSPQGVFSQTLTLLAVVPGESLSVFLRMAPTQLGPVLGTIVINSNAPSQMTSLTIGGNAGVRIVDFSATRSGANDGIQLTWLPIFLPSSLSSDFKEYLVFRTAVAFNDVTGTLPLSSSNDPALAVSSTTRWVDTSAPSNTVMYYGIIINFWSGHQSQLATYGPIVSFNSYGPVGSVFGTPGSSKFMPKFASAFNPNKNQFLIVYEASGAGGATSDSIMAQLIDGSTKALTGTAINTTLSVVAGPKSAPSVAYHPIAQRYLLAFSLTTPMVNSNMAIIGTQWLNADGTAFGNANATISLSLASGAPASAFKPSLLYNSLTQGFILSCEGGANSSFGIFSQYINSDWTNGGFYPVFGNGVNVQTVLDPVNNEVYFAALVPLVSGGYGVFLRKRGTDGSSTAASNLNLQLGSSVSTSPDNVGLSLAYNSVSGELFLVYNRDSGGLTVFHGSIVGSLFSITIGPGDLSGSFCATTFNPIASTFLQFWQQPSGGSTVIGGLQTPAGGFGILGVSQLRPLATIDPVAQRTLVTWVDATAGVLYRLAGQFVEPQIPVFNLTRASGALLIRVNASHFVLQLPNVILSVTAPFSVLLTTTNIGEGALSWLLQPASGQAGWLTWNASQATLNAGSSQSVKATISTFEASGLQRGPVQQECWQFTSNTLAAVATLCVQINVTGSPPPVPVVVFPVNASSSLPVEFLQVRWAATALYHSALVFDVFLMPGAPCLMSSPLLSWAAPTLAQLAQPQFALASGLSSAWYTLGLTLNYSNWYFWAVRSCDSESLLCSMSAVSGFAARDLAAPITLPLATALPAITVNFAQIPGALAYQLQLYRLSNSTVPYNPCDLDLALNQDPAMLLASCYPVLATGPGIPSIAAGPSFALNLTQGVYVHRICGVALNGMCGTLSSPTVIVVDQRAPDVVQLVLHQEDFDPLLQSFNITRPTAALSLVGTLQPRFTWASGFKCVPTTFVSAVFTIRPDTGHGPCLVLSTPCDTSTMVAVMPGEGDYRVEAMAVDALGNQAPTFALNFTVKITPPALLTLNLSTDSTSGYSTLAWSPADSDVLGYVVLSTAVQYGDPNVNWVTVDASTGMDALGMMSVDSVSALSFVDFVPSSSNQYTVTSDLKVSPGVWRCLTAVAVDGATNMLRSGLGLLCNMADVPISQLNCSATPMAPTVNQLVLLQSTVGKATRVSYRWHCELLGSLIVQNLTGSEVSTLFASQGDVHVQLEASNSAGFAQCAFNLHISTAAPTRTINPTRSPTHRSSSVTSSPTRSPHPDQLSIAPVRGVFVLSFLLSLLLLVSC